MVAWTGMSLIVTNFGVYQAMSIAKMTQVVWASRGCLVLIASECPFSFSTSCHSPCKVGTEGTNLGHNGRVEPPTQGGSLMYWRDATECHLPMRRICTSEKHAGLCLTLHYAEAVELVPPIVKVTEFED